MFSLDVSVCEQLVRRR